MRGLAVCLALSCVLSDPVATPGWAQMFDVASVKRSPPPPPNPFGFPPRFVMETGPGGTFKASQVRLRDLLRRAYDLPDFLILGVPESLVSDRFEVVAKAGSGVAADATQISAMLRALLAERFRLRAHIESRDLPVFALVTTRRNALGPALEPSMVDCAAVDCSVSYQMRGGAMTISFRGQSMPQFARVLLEEARRPVLDRTGLAGIFDGAVSFAPDPLPGLPAPPGCDGCVTIFTALQEQLGLKLEPARGPVDVLVVDSADQPTEN